MPCIEDFTGGFEMFKVMRALPAALILILFPAVQSAADWSVYKKIEARSEDKSILRIERYSGGPVRAWFILSRRAEGAFESKLPLYRVDNNEVHNLQNAEKMHTDKNKNYWILWQIYDGKGDISDDLLELINGKEAVFQYYLPDGEIRESIFSLKGAKEAFGEILR